MALCTAGCAKSCKNDHPYVPYAVGDGSGAAAVEDASSAEPGVDAGGQFAEQGAVAAPPNTTTFNVDGLTLVAPAGRDIVLALVRDFDGDGAKDAVAVVRTPSPPDAGEAVYYRGRAGSAVEAPVALATVPLIAVEPPCVPVARLGQVGKSSVVVEVGASCGSHEPPIPARWLAVVSLSAAPRVHFSASIADPVNAPHLSIDADGSDHDHDGVDDVTLRVSLEGGGPPFEPAPRVSATLRWLDRPSGMSRDPDEPDASLRALASGAATHAARARDAATVPLLVQQIRALYAAICTEGGGPRLTSVLGGASLTCGASRGLEEAGLAEVRALALSGDPLRAIGAFDRAQRSPATHTPPRTNDALAWLAQAAPTLSATTMRAIGAVPQIDRGHAPAWGALAFEPSGKVLVRTLAGVVRVDPLLGDEADAEGVSSWKSGVVSPDGAARWIEAYNPCTGPALHATFAPTGDGDAHDVALPIPWPVGVRCASAKGEPVPTIPIAWGPRGLEAVVAGDPILIAPGFARATLLASSFDQPVTLGAPRSPSGKVLAIPTSQGILVKGARTRLFRAKEIDNGYLELRDCTVSDDAARVACVRGGRAFVGVWEPPP